MRNTLVVSIALLLGSTASLPAWSAPVAATAPAIAPMPLDQALELFARNSGLQLMYDPALAAGQRSSGAPAGLAPAQQLQKLLAGTGLDYRMPTPSTVSIVRGAAAAPRSAAAPRAAPAAATPAADPGDRDDGPRELAPINVTANSVDTLAPSAAPLEASQPTSVIDERFIRDGLRLNANYDDIIKYAPSVVTTSPEGPGLGKNEGISIRGFQDGQFNITFDGIPFGDASDLHHTTSAYFNNHVLGQAEIDRGPGGGATIGNATFGGTLALRTRNPSAVDGVTAYVTGGSWDTWSTGVSADEHIGNTRVFADLSKETSDTYLKGTDDRREHAFVKTVTELGEATTLSFVSSYNQEHQNTMQGATRAQIAQHGWRYGLGNDPTLQNYTGYNSAAYYSSFSYLGLSTRLGDWDLDNKVYYNSFDHTAAKSSIPTSESAADNGVTFYSSTGKKLSKAAKDVPGKLSDNDFHAFGDVLRLARELGPGQLQTGVWAERNLDERNQLPVDMSTGAASGTKYGYLYNYQLHDRTDTLQPYVQYDWKLSDTLTLSPGVRYSRVERQLDAQLNKRTPPAPAYSSASYDATLPSLSLHDAFSEHWSGYVQAARGFLAPPIDVIELNGARGLQPELTSNYQLGTSYAARGLTFGADVYYIDFSNYISQTLIATDSGSESAYVNGGGAVYRGAEAEATYALTPTLSLYANASYNEATYKHSSTQVAGTPHVTGALGLLYNSGSGYFGSLMEKVVGAQYGVDNSTDASGATVFGNDQRLGGYASLDAALGYRSTHGPYGLKGYSISMDVNNLLDRHALIGYAGARSSDNQPLYFGLAGRGVFLDLSLKF
ncbi:TonB-dependent receptor domain-containing protein [Xanthomonas translucens]|uniref:TonB-dependent receptor domain-containing protein n=1 Tax=Xanthomonas campestris pv. translucens TaxID=343 RepID=UPI0019D70899|nr:TonB-dependent receptor [Xanthomonas translucens]QSQ52219.1 TonB-dependent receptor [Xanthomonas translucens pv. undulosa]QSQ58863.1 TonB-dependent receptor [Xanthomonas translucens pv. undulosa]UJB14904.1 TonB-dependent receptor [Xanthomonas translucens pv. undulosa]